MDNNTEFSIALNLINRKIAHLNIELSKVDSKEMREKLDECLKLKKEIDNGNIDVIKKIINKEE